MSGERKESVAVVGAGSWGTAFAAMLAGAARIGHPLGARGGGVRRPPGPAGKPRLPPGDRAFPGDPADERPRGGGFREDGGDLRGSVPSPAAGGGPGGGAPLPRRVPRLPGQGGGERYAEADDGGARRGVPGARPPRRGSFRPDLRPRGGGREADGGHGGGARPLRRAAAAARAVRFPLPPLRRRRRDGDRDRRGAEKRDGDRRGDGRRAGVRPQRPGAPHLPGARRDLPAGRPPRGELRRRSRGSRGWGTWSSPARATSRGTGPWGCAWGGGRGSATSSRG